MAADKILFIGGQIAFDATGKIRFVDAAAIADCECCGDICSTDCTALGTCYQIQGYADGDLTGCVTCDPEASYPPGFITDGPWPGDFVQRTGGGFPLCIWDKDPAKVYSIDGKLLMGNTKIELVNPGGGDPCYWQMTILCGDLGFIAIADVTLWQGEKLTGSTPEGDYTYSSGCDTTTTLTVEAC